MACKHRILKVLLLSSLTLLLMVVCLAEAQAYLENSCLSFESDEGYVSCGSPDVEVYKASSLTLELWVKPKYTIKAGSDAQYNRTTGVLASYTDTWLVDDGWTLYFDYSTGHLNFDHVYAWYGFRIHTLTTWRSFWNASEWHHVAVTFDRRNPEIVITFYINRATENHETIPVGYYIRYKSSSLMIGQHPGHGFFNGRIDEVRFWNTSRNQTEIESTWKRTLTEREQNQPELIGYWRFDEGSGDYSEDLSTQDNYAYLRTINISRPDWFNPGAPIIHPWLWDITGPIPWIPDCKCDMRDVALVAKLFGSLEGDGRYDPRADIMPEEPDGKIDMKDVALTAKHFGEIDP